MNLVEWILNLDECILLLYLVSASNSPTATSESTETPEIVLDIDSDLELELDRLCSSDSDGGSSPGSSGSSGIGNTPPKNPPPKVEECRAELREDEGGGVRTYPAKELDDLFKGKWFPS